VDSLERRVPRCVAEIRDRQRRGDIRLGRAGAKLLWHQGACLIQWLPCRVRAAAAILSAA